MLIFVAGKQKRAKFTVINRYVDFDQMPICSNAIFQKTLRQILTPCFNFIKLALFCFLINPVGAAVTIVFKNTIGKLESNVVLYHFLIKFKCQIKKI